MKTLHKLVRGLHGYLEFEFACHRGYAFNERGLSSAVMQIIASNEGLTKIECETAHPFLKQPAKGRPKVVDFHWKENGGGKDVFLELKWFGESSPTMNAILRDIYRLAILHQKMDARAYFVMAGMSTKIIKFLESDSNARIARGEEYSLIRCDDGNFPSITNSQIVKQFNSIESDLEVELPKRIKLLDPSSIIGNVSNSSKKLLLSTNGASRPALSVVARRQFASQYTSSQSILQGRSKLSVIGFRIEGYAK